MSIFKANDVRGIYGKELGDKDAYAIGNAFVRFAKTKRVVVGRDNRVSSPALFRSLARGILDAGADVLDIGEIDSPGFYFATAYLDNPGIMITASHNPAEYNGFYISLKRAEIISENNGLKDIERLSMRKAKIANIKGRILQAHIMRAYVKHVMGFVSRGKMRKIKVVVDAGNGVGARIASEVYSRIPWVKLVKLYFESDGRYLHRGPDPSKSENLVLLGRKVRETGADFGVAFDADADRAGLVDERGEVIEGSIAGALLAGEVLKKNKGGVVYSSTCSRILPEIIKSLHGIPIRDRVGHALIKSRMRKERAVLGIESTGHFMFADNFYADSGIVASIVMCELFARQKRKMSQLVKPLMKYYKASEINFDFNHNKIKMRNILEGVKKLKPRKIDLSDGIYADFGRTWVSIRESQTEPLLRLVVEGKNREDTERRKSEMTEIIRSIILR